MAFPNIRMVAPYSASMRHRVLVTRARSSAVVPAAGPLLFMPSSSAACNLPQLILPLQQHRALLFRRERTRLVQRLGRAERTPRILHRSIEIHPAP